MEATELVSMPQGFGLTVTIDRRLASGALPNDRIVSVDMGTERWDRPAPVGGSTASIDRRG